MKFIKNIINYVIDYFRNIEFSSGGKLEEWLNTPQNSQAVQNVNSVVNVIFKYGAIIGAIIFVIWIVRETDLIYKIHEWFLNVIWLIALLAFFFVAMAAV